MKHETLLAVCVLSLLASPALAQDVYNFYFQKADKTTSQGQVKPHDDSAPQPQVPSAATSKASSAAPTAPASPTGVANEAPAAAAPAEAAEVNGGELKTSAMRQEAPAIRERPWQINVSYGTTVDYLKQFQGFSAGAEYALNRYLAMQGELMTGKATSYYAPVENPNRTFIAAAAGARVTPIHIEVFGWPLIELSVLGGVMSTNGRSDDQASESRIAPYLGWGLNLNFTRQVSFLAQMRFADVDPRYGQSNLGVAVRF